MKKLSISLVALSFGAIGFAQDCLPVKDGQKYKLSSISYDTPVGQDINKWTKTKPEKRKAIIADHNEKVAAGKMKPKFTYDMTYNVSDVKNVDGFEDAKMSTSINNVEYVSYLSCKDDTIYASRRRGFQEAISPQGKKIGYSSLGTAKIQKNIKVGDEVAPYVDLMFTYPDAKVVEIPVKTGSGVNQISGYQWVEITKVGVLETKSFLTTQLHNAVAEVVGTTEFKLGKKAYTAYIIESEIWTKTYADFSYDSKSSLVNVEKMTKKVNEYWTKKVDKGLRRKELVNDEGYIVSYKTEWFVPELGIVNLVVKSQGFVTSETKLVEIK